jgi:uncharacterized protein (DUF305 family)
MKIIVQSIMFITVVFLVAISADRFGIVGGNPSIGMGNKTELMGEKEFLTDVIAHHEGAITMAYVALDHSDRPEIIELANTIITMEKKNIDATYVWRRDWYQDSSHIFIDQVDPKITMIKDLGSKDADFDSRFLNAMITHHEGAIKMLSANLTPDTREEIRTMSTGAIAGLSQDIILMQKWLKEWYAK